MLSTRQTDVENEVADSAEELQLSEETAEISLDDDISEINLDENPVERYKRAQVRKILEDKLENSRLQKELMGFMLGGEDEVSF